MTSEASGSTISGISRHPPESLASSNGRRAKEDWAATWEEILEDQPDYTFDLQSAPQALGLLPF